MQCFTGNARTVTVLEFTSGIARGWELGARVGNCGGVDGEAIFWGWLSVRMVRCDFRMVWRGRRNIKKPAKVRGVRSSQIREVTSREAIFQGL